MLTALVDDRQAVLPELDTGDPASAAIARDFTCATLTEWDAQDHTFDAQLIISELVTNAMRHVGGRIGVYLLRDGSRLACAVTDSGSSLPVVGAEDCFAESGRGLQLVQAMSSAWGCMLDHGRGKLVWVVLAP
ncbi:hypothetical protein Misp01_77040 [Microtetraspora sp. NBRC 13810]|uniref:ATP-binding protein n=1 Tax=Microtetraspora sp. NBRC 13810 TaxID=3030990 RepID=UPI0024A5D4ED|nr:ATP-binding protein [Microtetraspora sp. NBRC 13810]GLW12576.1 hypothetical protein Misp01_77040 [Microtetraspora sp. NBRC 13810]